MLIYSCSDLIFATKIRSTAEVLRVESRPARNLDMLRARLDQVDDGKVNEPVTVVMIDLELGEQAFELIKLAAQHTAKVSGADSEEGSAGMSGGDSGEGGPTVIAFAPHVMTEAMAGAERIGADLVMARGSFTNQLPELIKQYGS
ncbi:MAG: hypothetical protein AAF593_08365 [Planctomycetota bacterium]